MKQFTTTIFAVATPWTDAMVPSCNRIIGDPRARIGSAAIGSAAIGCAAYGRLQA